MIDAAHDRLVNVECSIINDFKFLIDKLYLVDYSGVLSDARGIIFEELVHIIGIESEFVEKYREAQIYLEGEADQLGKSGHDFDSIFHNNKNVHLIECKISASSFLRLFNGSYKQKSTSKLNYMKRTGEELNNQNMNNSLFLFTGSYSVKKIKRDFKKKYNSIELLARRDVLKKCMG
ncbi:hypothetical protein [Shouchella miscanthi]|uniref:Restriction endonuclease type IV Mrr domain-containing protein n=1 Tax=Shouchella miscanthi TaxID=2598861 RepID=A0ABU6NLC8_9BACI|nr:hypothetical protein [Shouchella miscanthi]